MDIDMRHDTSTRPAPTPFRYRNASAAAAYLGLSTGAVYHMVQRRLIPHIRVGRKLLFDQQALDRWLSANTSVPQVAPIRQDA
jgi:excisionase family DNA binding protein